MKYIYINIIQDPTELILKKEFDVFFLNSVISHPYHPVDEAHYEEKRENEGDKQHTVATQIKSLDIVSYNTNIQPAHLQPVSSDSSPEQCICGALLAALPVQCCVEKP